MARKRLSGQEILLREWQKLGGTAVPKYVKRLPTYKGYTIDERLREFRKVDITKPDIQFIPFKSEKCRKLLAEIRKLKKVV